jgi:hypothetical protein
MVTDPRANRPNDPERPLSTRVPPKPTRMLDDHGCVATLRSRHSEKHRPTAAERFGARQAGGGEVSGDGWLIGPAPRQGYAGAIAPLAPAGHRARCFILIHHSPRHKMRRLAAGPRRSPPLMPHRRENRPRYRRPRAATRRKPPRRSSACGAYGARSCGRRRPQSCRR